MPLSAPSSYTGTAPKYSMQALSSDPASAILCEDDDSAETASRTVCKQLILSIMGSLGRFCLSRKISAVPQMRRYAIMFRASGVE